MDNALPAATLPPYMLIHDAATVPAPIPAVPKPRTERTTGAATTAPAAPATPPTT